jgi:hypothetical protein
MLRKFSLFESVKEQLNKTVAFPPFRSPLESEKNDDASSSIFSVLSQSVGWFNPFGISHENAKKLFYMTCFLNNFGSINAVACFASNTIYQGYALFCGTEDGETPNYVSPMEETLRQLVINNCDVHMQDKCPHLLNDKLINSFGLGYFGGYRCSLYSNVQPGDSCVVNVLKNNTPSGYGTNADIGATFGIVIAGGIGVVGLSLMGCCSLLFALDKCKSGPFADEELTTLRHGK